MNKEWIVFYNKLTSEKLSSISIEGSFEGEIKSTVELLAYENGLRETDIEVKYE
jgi:hypothetical protein